MTNSDAIREIATVGAQATASAVPAATVVALVIAVGLVLLLAGLRWAERRRLNARHGPAPKEDAAMRAALGGDDTTVTDLPAWISSGPPPADSVTEAIERMDREWRKQREAGRG